MPSLSTHVLDASRGGPVAGVAVEVTDSDGRLVAAGETDPDGRIAKLGAEMAAGRYRISWEPPADPAAVFVAVAVTVDLRAERHYHVPILASPASAVVYLGV
jgi:5-hydroxyisourate hydrolase